MKRLATLSAAAVIGLGAIASTGAEARGRGGAIAAGVIGGVAAGALLGAATSNSYAAPAYGYPAYGYDEAPVYRTRRVVRSYDYDMSTCLPISLAVSCAATITATRQSARATPGVARPTTAVGSLPATDDNERLRFSGAVHH